MADNPFPASWAGSATACETACNRAQLDKAVGINSVERYLGDQAIAQGWPVYADEAPAAAARTGYGEVGGGAGDRRGALGPVGRLSPDPPWR